MCSFRTTARDPSTVTRFVDRATEDGLVEQRPGTHDRRERLLFLTPSGRATRDAILGARAARTTRIVAGVAGRTGLGPDEVDWFLSALYAALVSDAEAQATSAEKTAEQIAERSAERAADAPPVDDSTSISGA